MEGPPQLVVALSGRTLSGKSSVTRVLSERLGWPSVSFGDFVRAEAAERGLPDSREVLQDLGQDLISELGWEDFCVATLDNAGLDSKSAPCIIEGVRHVDALSALRSAFSPASVLHVHLDVSDELRAVRLEAAGIPEVQGEEWEEHMTERDVAEILPEEADLRVTVTGQSVEVTAGEIQTWIEAK